MKPGRRKFLLALFGALSAVAAFQLAMPFVGSLAHPGMQLGDPGFKFPFGTTWATVEYTANGALLCGPICFVLVLGSRGPKWAWIVGILGTVIGGLAGYVANGVADELGIAADRKFGSVPFLPQALWSVVVPLTYALTIAIVLGPTRPRLRRALYAAFYGAVGSFIAVIGAEAVVQALISTGRINLDPSQLGDGGLGLAKASIPVWEATATAAGFAIGAVFGLAEQASRAASLLLVLGRNEGREWNLDGGVSRIGSAEGNEVYLSGMSGIAPVHARIVRHSEGYGVEETGAGPIMLNGLPIPGGAWLNNSDTLGIGSVVLGFSSQVNARAQGFPPLTSPAYSMQSPLAPVAQVAPQAPLPSTVAMHPQTPAASGQASLIDAFGNAYPLHPGSNSVGRDAGVAVNLGWDSSVSRQHAEIVLSPAGGQIRDLGSTNGTKVNGQPVQGPTPLKSGDHVQIGHVSLTFQA